MSLNATLASVTRRIAERSRPYRTAYLARLDAARHEGVQRGALSCTNLAHGFAAFPANDKLKLKQDRAPSVAIVSSYNDMLSAHQPFERYPQIIRDAVREDGGVAQFAGGVPAMCDGVTQGRAGMELSLFSRDLIAMATAVALSHDMFDGALYLGICDKIVPGLLIRRQHFQQHTALSPALGQCSCCPVACVIHSDRDCPHGERGRGIQGGPGPALVRYGHTP